MSEKQVDLDKLAEELEIIAKLPRAPAVRDMPEELQRILWRYVELYRLAQKCNDAIVDRGLIVVDTNFNIWFDSVGSIVGPGVPLEDLAKEWDVTSLCGRALHWKAYYEGQTAMKAMWPSVDELLNLLKPLEDVGWCISATQKSESEYEVSCLVSDDAMMAGVRQKGDEAFLARFFGFNAEVEDEVDYEAVIAIAEKAVSREEYALEVMEGYGVTREGLGLSKEPPICRILEDIIEAARSRNLDVMKSLLENVDIPQVRESLSTLL